MTRGDICCTKVMWRGIKRVQALGMLSGLVYLIYFLGQTIPSQIVILRRKKIEIGGFRCCAKGLKCAASHERTLCRVCGSTARYPSNAQS
ncbi:uncharacterized protein BDR25DRAFT_58283 [Lindgomyces ingoldianus]|uniref:Uncharacterized protein n=1 Tax=Lindgomyces ingoldianus TaxID=673940 RepID=A0ACB6QMN0_9PLEO|nr:uncharacterized protein BDR25DRAFT_58283 [Lindgomyces ingoldianus]KAF2468166.1 hypothetical protein BDR25DRAFT_58283 [Lindgomyces ingoldianus]